MNSTAMVSINYWRYGCNEAESSDLANEAEPAKPFRKPRPKAASATSRQKSFQASLPTSLP